MIKTSIEKQEKRGDYTVQSIIQKDKTHCYICKRNGNVDPLDCHH